MRMADLGTLYSISSSNDSTVFVEVVERRLTRKNKYFVFFERFAGELIYDPNEPLRCRLTLEIEANSMRCQDQRLRPNKPRRVAKFVREFIADSAAHPIIRFSSHEVSVKPLRGFALEGTLTVRGMSSVTKLNAVLSQRDARSLELEADSMLKLSEFGIKPLATFLSMIRFDDQATVQIHLNATRVAP